MEKYLKVGDKVMWRGGFGEDPPKEAIIEEMEVTLYPRQKYGRRQNIVPYSEVEKNRVLFTLKNGHWAYSEQITPIGGF